MIIREVLDQERSKYDQAIHHPLQAWAWGEFRLDTGVDVIRLGAFEGQTLKAGYQATIHTVPKLNYKLGYFPKGEMPDEGQIFALKTIAEKHNLTFIKVEPDIYSPVKQISDQVKQARIYLEQNGGVKARPMFTPHSFVMDISLSEEELFAKLKSKTRYNVRVALKKRCKCISR